jgi:hypothetical protein
MGSLSKEILSEFPWTLFYSYALDVDNKYIKIYIKLQAFSVCWDNTKF